MTRIAVFIKLYSIGKSSPVVCMLDLLSEYYDSVDIYAQDIWCTEATVLNKDNVQLIKVPNPQGGILERISAFFSCQPKYDELHYDDYLSFDPHGFLLCKELFPEASPIYYSLELYFKNNYFNLHYSHSAMEREHAAINGIKGLIIQSQERESLLREEYQLSSNIKSFFLPVTYLEPSVEEKSSFLREKFNIPASTRICLHLGGIQEFHSCIEIALSFASLNGWVLIFHGFHSGPYINKLKDAISEKRINNVFISQGTYELLEDMDQIVMSCDMGIAWYNDVSPNFTTAGKSSGKISAYLRFGLPVVSKKYPSTIEALEETGCGVCVDDFDEIPDAVRKIETDIQTYSDNCRKEYDHVYWFNNYRENLIEFIQSEATLF